MDSLHSSQGSHAFSLSRAVSVKKFLDRVVRVDENLLMTRRKRKLNPVFIGVRVALTFEICPQGRGLATPLALGETQVAGALLDALSGSARRVEMRVRGIVDGRMLSFMVNGIRREARTPSHREQRVAAVAESTAQDAVVFGVAGINVPTHQTPVPNPRRKPPNIALDVSNGRAVDNDVPLAIEDSGRPAVSRRRHRRQSDERCNCSLI